MKDNMDKVDKENYFDRIVGLSSTTNTYRLLMELRELKNLGYYNVFCSGGIEYNICKLIRHIKYLREKGYTYEQIIDDVMNRR